MHYLFLSWRDLAHPLAGGSEVLVDRLARGLLERGHRVDVLCGGPAGDRPYPVVSVGGTYTQYLNAPLRYLLDHRRADVVVDVVNGMPYLSPLWRRRPTVSLVNHVHTEHWRLWYPEPLAALGRSIESRLFPAVHGRRLVVAVSASTAAALIDIGIPPASIRVVHNGVDQPEAPVPESPDPLFLAAGRLVPHKRFDVLLRLWDRVRPVVGGRLVVIGDGPERDRLRAMAGPGVSLPGWVSDEQKHRLMAEARLLLHPASVEGWGLVVMEAAARGTPTVGFDVAGVRDSVEDGRSGALVATEEEFADAWTWLALDGRRRRALGRYARTRAGSFTWSATVDRFCEVGEEAVAGAPYAARVPLPPVAPVPAAATGGPRA